MIDLATERLMTVPEAARRLGKSHTTIKRWILAGLLEGIQLPSGPHTSLEALERMAERLSQERGIGRQLPASAAAVNRADAEAVKYLRRQGVL